jgi:ribosome-associated translation inhibitor RaiA
MIIELGGNIELVGFKEVDGGSMIILKKIVGNYVRKMNDMSGKFEKLTLTMKDVHKSENSGRFEVHAKAINNGKVITSENTDNNLFVTVDKVLGSVATQISK